MAELYSSVLIVGMVVALSYFVFTQAVVSRHAANSLAVTKQYRIYGDPALLFLQLNSSGPIIIDEMRVDAASSLSGVLYLGRNGYGVTNSLCASASTTFFSVFASIPGNLSVITNGQPWIDGNGVASEAVSPGWHEVIIRNGSSCAITLPGGGSVNTISGGVSTYPVIRSVNSTSLESYTPIATNGHSITFVLEDVVETIGF